MGDLRLALDVVPFVFERSSFALGGGGGGVGERLSWLEKEYREGEGSLSFLIF